MVAVFCILLSLATLAWGQSKDRSFTNKERQYILDLHNFLRYKVAVGKEPSQPPADYMLALEWDDRLEERAQKWSDGCPTYHSQDNSWYRKVKPYETGENRVEGSLYADFERAITQGWYDEYKGYNYGSNYCSISACGHYTQVLWQNTTLLGCGWNRCKRTKVPVMFCQYGPGGNIYPLNGNRPKRPYQRAAKGAQCKKCPMGFENCMDGGLCATSLACKGSKSQCTCPIKSCKNGGKLNKAKCHCQCVGDWEGTQCEVPCKDTFGIETNSCNLPGNQAGCKWDSSKHMWAVDVCRKSCGACGTLLGRDKNRKNKHGIKTNVFKTKPKNPRQIGGGGKAKCPNKSGDADCDLWASTGECKNNPKWMKKNCAKSCNSCPVCKNKSPDADCDVWALTDQCKENPKWMLKACKKSCNACGA